MREKIKGICEVGILVAIGLVLKIISDLIPFLNMFEGGTIDLSMLPIILIGLRCGYKYSFIGSTIYWLLAWLIGGLKIDHAFLEILLDRFIPYTIGYGISGLYQKYRVKPFICSIFIILSGLIRLSSHTLSGIILWSDIFNIHDFLLSIIPNLLYNLTYVGVTTLLSVVLFISLNKVLFLRASSL